jgi:hypothetical protein
MAGTPTFRELNRFLNKLSENLCQAIEDGAIPRDWLCSSKGNSDYMLHSRVWGILAKTGFDLDYIVELDAGFRPDGSRQFKPDVQLWKSNDLRFLIEYESTNSSYAEVLLTDLQRYVDSGENEDFPRYWLIIYTLPDNAIDPSAWKFWHIKKNDPLIWRIAENPHKYYKDFLKTTHIQKGLDDFGGSENGEVVFANLTEGGLEIDFPSRLNRKYPFRSPRSKR